MMTRLGIKGVLAAVTATSLSVTAPAARAQDAGKVIVGGMIVCALTNCLGNRRPSGGQAAPRGDATVMQDQTALNYFGYNVGAADGVTGQKTRSGISQYQAYMGYPVTGQLDPTQRANLHNAHAWAQSGRASAYPGITGPELLRAYGAEVRGGNYCQETGRCAYSGAPSYGGGTTQPGVFDVSNRGGQLPSPQVVTPKEAPSLGGFGDLKTAGPSRSMAGHCQNIGFLTAANGGETTSPDRITNATQALDEQFCNAREDAIALTEQRVAGASITDAQLAEVCGQTVALLDGQMATLDTQSPPEVTVAASQLAQSKGWSKEVMVQTGEICLGYGYRTDDAAMALASSMLLVAAGATPYAEMFGHHKRLGFGSGVDTGRATAWYGTAFDALEQGATPAFLPAQSAQRVAIMRAALGSGGAPAGGAAASAGGSSLPGFGLGNN